jgi:hypothetical protein
MAVKPPKIDNAPGLVWKPRKNGFVAYWEASSDLPDFAPRSARLWTGREDELSPTMIDYIVSQCERLQSEMIVWKRGGIPIAGVYSGTWASLMDCYQSDRDSNFRSLRFCTRKYYGDLMKRIRTDHGDELVADFRARQSRRWHEDWTAEGRVAMAHALIGMVRTLVNFGATILEDDACVTASGFLHLMKFKVAKSRDERLTLEMVNLIRAKAHAEGLHSIALANTLSWVAMARQRDVLGEWVPITEPGISDIHSGNEKWLRGFRWEYLDENLTLRHTTSKRGKLLEVPLPEDPMIMEEFARIGTLPKSGPMVVCEFTGLPWDVNDFRRRWRLLATACGIPSSVRYMDTRAGAISEATGAGAPLEHVRHAATHSNESTTQRYSRGGAEKTGSVMKTRVASRQNKPRT